MINIMGVQHARGLVASDEILSKIKATTIVLGAKALDDNKTTLQRQTNQGKVLVFVTSKEAAISAYNMGFLRVFIVSALCRISAQDVVDADSTPQSLIDQNMKVHMLAGATATEISALEAIKNMSSCISNRDPEGLAAVLLNSGSRIQSATDSILKMIKCANTITGVEDLRKQFEKCKKEKEMLASKIDELTAELNKASDCSSGDSVDKKILIETEGRLSVLQTEYKELQCKLSEVNNAVLTLEKDLLNKTEENVALYADLTTEQNILRKNNSNLALQIETLKSELTSSSLTITGLQDDLRDAKNELVIAVSKYNASLTESSELTQEFENVTQELNQLKANSEDTDLIETVARLKLQLSEANKEKMSTKSLKTIMPIIGSNFALNARRVVCFKEIRPVIYMNSFLTALNNTLQEVVGKQQRKSYCIVVLDMMLNDFDVFKYSKKKFNINSPPVMNQKKPKMISVINNFDLGFLKNTMKLQNYDYLFIVDRLGLVEPSVQHSSLMAYYMINSIRDVFDLNLKGLNTIVYGNCSQALDGSGRFAIEPSGELYGMGGDEREFRFYKSEFFTKLLKHAEVTL